MTTANCPQCGTQLPANSPQGLCPKCLLQAGLQSAVESPGTAETAPSPAAGRGFVPPAPEELAEHFPQLEILQLIGHGGMGAVYKARQRELDRLVALKILPPEVGSDPAFAERFSREARALARLNHANIVGVYDSGKAGEFYFLTMELIDGVNLRQAMQAGSISPEEAVAIVPQICDALQYAHDEGIVHRDIKPENVLVDAKGRVKIADFGLAKLLQHNPNDFTLTQAQQVMGTPRYMAPEQMTASANVDHRADIYSLGVVFYELLTGEVPMGRFDPPSKRVQVDVRLDEIVLRTLDREPDRRYQHASEIKSDVETLHHQPAVRTSQEAATPHRSAIASDTRKAISQVKAPAVGLIIVGVLTILTAPLFSVLLSGQWANLMLDSSGFDLERSGDAMGEYEDIEAEPPPWPPEESFDAEPPDAATEEATDEMPDETTLDAPGQSGLRDAGRERVSHFPLRPATGSMQLTSPAFRSMPLAQDYYDDPPHVTTRDILAMIALAIVGALPSLVMGGVMILAGWRMLQVQSYGLAVTASFLAMIPCQPVYCLGLLFGIWSLVVLSREHVKEAFEETARRKREGESASPEELALRASRGPAIGMIVMGMLNVALGVLLTGMMVHEVVTRWGLELGPVAVLTWFVVYTLASIGVAVAGFRFWALRSYRWVFFAAVFLLLPTSLLSLAGMPLGIWALAVLMRENVKSVFEEQAILRKPFAKA